MAGTNKPLTTVVYRSLGQVWEALGCHAQSKEVKHLAELCSKRGLTEKSAGESVITTFRDPSSCPFIVIEGLDGTGKTTLTKYLSKSLNMTQISTPPKLSEFVQARSYFDNQPESLRRAFYSLGNYFASQDVVNCKQPVVMDRFWHSTAAYAMAHQVSLGEQLKPEDFVWPEDLLRPDLVIFLEVSEQERIRRHTSRADFTNTAEEQTLADNKSFRESLRAIYRKISGPRFLELNVDGEQPLVEARILKTVVDSFPMVAEADKLPASN